MNQGAIRLKDFISHLMACSQIHTMEALVEQLRAYPDDKYVAIFLRTHDYVLEQESFDCAFDEITEGYDCE